MHLEPILNEAVPIWFKLLLIIRPRYYARIRSRSMESSVRTSHTNIAY